MTDSIEERKHWLGLLARAPVGRVSTLLEESGLQSDFQFLRRPECGTVMVRGRMGGTGTAFNLAEMTVTRATVRLDSGEVGHGHVAGRSKTDAQAAAVVDALMQTSQAATAKSTIVSQLEIEETANRTTRQSKAAATKVDFFTMVRGED